MDDSSKQSSSPGQPPFIAGQPNFSAFFRFIPAPWHLALWALLLAAVQGGVIVALGLSVQRIFDQAIPNRNLQEAALICALLFVVYGIQILLESVASVRISEIVRRTMLKLRLELAAHALRLPRIYYQQSDVGSLHVDWVQESSRVETAARGAMTILAPQLASALVVAVFMVALNVWLSLLVWLVLGLGLIALLVIRPRIREAVQHMHTSHRAFSRHVLFILEMIDLVRLKNAEADTYRAHREIADTAEHSMHRLVRTRIHYNAALRLMITTMLIILLFGGSFLVLKTEALTIGGLLAFFAVAGIFRNALNQVLAQLPMLMDAAEALRRISRFLAVADRQPYTGRTPCTQLLPMRIENLTFAYQADTPPLIRDLNLSIAAGDILVMTGPSGAGKSTLALLCLGWYRPTQGRIQAGGNDYADLHMGTLRRRVGVVLQDPWLFAGSLHENLVFGLPSVVPSDVQWALEMAEADAFAARLPKGLHTPIGPRGVRLSGGEKQRLAIARALLGKPELLILDEPDNHLDRQFLSRLILRLTSALPACGIMLITHAQVDPGIPFTHVHLIGEAGAWEITTCS